MRDDRPGPLGGGDRNAGIERIGGVDGALQFGAKLVEPLLRPLPLTVHANRRVDERLAALERLESREVGVPRRRRIEHHSAADRGVGAQHDTVAARRDDRPRQAQLGEAVAGARHPRDRLRGAVVEHDASRDLSQRLERDVEAEARPGRSRRDEDVAAPQLLPLDAGQRDRDALPCLGALDRPVVHLHAAHPYCLAARLERAARRPRRPSPTTASRSRPSRSRAA